MGAAPSSYQQQGARGAKLLSAYPRAQIDLALSNPGTGGGNFNLPPGLSSLTLTVPGALVPGATPQHWPLRRNLLYRFIAGLITFASNPNLVALESCGFGAYLSNPANGAGFGAILSKASSLSALTALATGSPITIDEWEIDCNDAISMAPSVAGVPATFPYDRFALAVFLTVNNTGAVAQNLTISGTVKAKAASFDSYRFDTWD